jgi:Low specificity phosphatase (HAD superfamily)
MPFDPLHSLTPALIQRARRIRMACFDVDGTLTDGRLYYDHQGNESKAYFVQDGLGLKLLQRHGIVAVIITARNSASAAKRGADLKIETHTGVRDKLALLQQLCQREGIGWTRLPSSATTCPTSPACVRWAVGGPCRCPSLGGADGALADRSRRWPRRGAPAV